jgi:hypothetical protein
VLGHRACQKRGFALRGSQAARQSVPSALPSDRANAFHWHLPRRTHNLLYIYIYIQCKSKVFYIYIFVFILLVCIFTLEGTRDRKLATAACLQAMCDINVWAWEGMPVKLGRWAWLATGYVSIAEMAAFWHIGVSKSGLSPDRKYLNRPGRGRPSPCSAPNQPHVATILITKFEQVKMRARSFPGRPSPA